MFHINKLFEVYIYFYDNLFSILQCLLPSSTHGAFPWQRKYRTSLQWWSWFPWLLLYLVVHTCYSTVSCLEYRLKNGSMNSCVGGEKIVRFCVVHNILTNMQCKCYVLTYFGKKKRLFLVTKPPRINPPTPIFYYYVFL